MYVHRRNKQGVKPNYSDIKREMGISKPTVGKWIKTLLEAGHISEEIVGSKKILEITSKGKDLLSK